MTWPLWILVGTCLIAAAVAGLAWAGARRWAEATRALAQQVDAGRVAAPRGTPTRFDPRELDGLPAPVQRYVRAALTPGQSIVTAVSLAHAGHFNLSAGGQRWIPFTSRQRVVTRRPGFLWDARMSLLPGLAVRVHDGYAAGEGVLHAAAMGLLDLADLRGGGELARGELMRFLAEAAWYPTALLPSQGVRWAAVDDRAATATLDDGAVSVTLLFRFGDAGLIESVRAEGRGRMVGRAVVMAPWEGRWSDAQVRHGMTVPISGEVAWLLPEGRQPYWRGTLTSMGVEFAP